VFSTFLIIAVAAQAAPAPPPTDPAQPATPVESLATYVSANDYPVAALRRGSQGSVGFTLTISPEGRVTNCTISSSSGDADLDASTCRLMTMRARFQPARDRLGRPVQDRFSSRINWRLQGGEPELTRFEPFRMASTISTSGDGSLSCRVEVNGEASTTASGENCRAMLPYPGMEFPSRPGSRTEFTVAVAFTPTGASPVAVGARDYGTVAGSAEAEITIGPEGTIENCRVIQVSGGAASAPDYCQFLTGGGTPGFETTKDERPRTGRLRVTAYVRVTTAT
jgi:TonB family protein